MVEKTQWAGFKGRLWKEEINVRDFIQNNYTPYDGDESFLAGPTEATNKLWGKLQELQKEERAKGGVLDMETKVVTGLTAYGPGYIDESMKDLEQVVGLQTDKPLKRAFMPYGGIKMAEQACTTYGYQPSEELHKIFTKYHKTHNQGVFDIYTPEMKKARHNKIITGLPDTYGRGRIVGEVDMKITMERYEPKKMTRSEVEKAIVAYCDPVGTPCKECKCYKKCVKRMPFEWLSNEGLQEYYEFLYGIKVEVKE